MKKRPYTLQSRLVLLFAASIMLPILLFAWALSARFTAMFLEENRRAFTSTLDAIAQNIETYLGDLMRFAYTPNAYPDVLDAYWYINSGDYDSIPDPLRYNQVNSRYQTTMIKIFHLTRDEVLGAVFIPEKNPLHQSYVVGRVDPELRPVACTVPEDWLWQASGAKGSPVFSPAHRVDYYADGEKDVFSIICLVKDVDRGVSLGVMKADISADAVQGYFSNLETGSRSAFLLLDQDGHTIYSTRPVVIPESAVADGTTVRVDGDTFHVYEQRVPQSGWRLVYLASERDARSMTNAIYFFAALLACACFATAWILFTPRSKRMVNPLEDILSTLRKVEQGDLEVRAHPDSRSPDFRAIAEALNRTIGKLHLYIQREYKAVLARRNAEYLALQTQVDPHFLYNTLNSFIALNRMGEHRALEKSIIQLTRMFRYTCAKTGDSTIREEFAFLEEYLSLQQMRFEERLQYRVCAEAGVEDAPIPKLLVQPLVENAILHGMEDCPRPILVEVEARAFHSAFGEGLLIAVRDTGVGFDTSRLKGSKRVGLENVKERLELFSPDSFFSITSSPDTFTLCCIAFFSKPSKKEALHENPDC